MEIKRVADHFIVDLRHKNFHIYWPREWKFGENLIKRIAERMTEQEVLALDEIVGIMNSAIAAKREATEDEIKKITDVNNHMAHIISLQVDTFLHTCPYEIVEKLIEASQALIWISARKGLKEAFDKRLENLETPTERKIMDAQNIHDWFGTRALIARHITNDIMGIFRYALLNNDKKIIKSVMHNPTKDQICLYSFILQVFKEHPYHDNLDARSFDNPAIRDLKFQIVELYKYLIDTEDGKDLKDHITGDLNDLTTVLKEDAELDELWKTVIDTVKKANDINCINKLGSMKSYIEDLQKLYPRKSLINPDKVCLLSNEERRKAIVEVLEYWDSHLPSDVEWLKKQQTLMEQIKKEQQERIDAEDRAYVGKTQAEINAEKESLEMTLNDEDGKEVGSVPLN